MNEDVIKGSEFSREKKEKFGKLPNISRAEKIIIALGVLSLILTLIGGVFFLGRMSRFSETDELITPSPHPSPTPFQEPSETPLPAQSGTPTPTKKSNPTPLPSVTPAPAIKTKILSSSASLDGFRSSNGEGHSGLEIRSGRNMYLVSRGFVSFNLSNIPSGANIQKAILRLYQAKIIGNPYSVGGSLKVDHLTYGDSLEDGDYAISTLTSSFATLATNSAVECKDVDVTDTVRDDIANARSKSQFRIHFQTENTGRDATGDFTYFEANENSQSSGNIPQLVVEYY